MFYTTRIFTWARAVVAALLAALTVRPAAALLVTPTVRLYAANVAPNPLSTSANFTSNEATFTGYAAAVVAGWTTVVNFSGETVGIVASVSFTMTATDATGEAIYGYWIDNGAGADYVGAELFPNPVPFAQAGDTLLLDVVLPLQMTPQVS